jgi:hypothetical protein
MGFLSPSELTVSDFPSSLKKLWLKDFCLRGCLTEAAKVYGHCKKKFTYLPALK